jgi:copper chaperone CopZ
MKNSKILALSSMFFAMLFFAPLNAQEPKRQTETFKVWGNCGMCKKTIENALAIRGVINAEWNEETQMITVIFKPKSISLSEIHKKIAAVGYDTALEKADDEVYEGLHHCCKYERTKK